MKRKKVEKKKKKFTDFGSKTIWVEPPPKSIMATVGSFSLLPSLPRRKLTVIQAKIPSSAPSIISTELGGKKNPESLKSASTASKISSLSVPGNILNPEKKKGEKRKKMIIFCKWYFY